MSDVEKLLHFKSSKPTTTKPSLNLEAQVLSPPLPAPIPEPRTWLIFGFSPRSLDRKCTRSVKVGAAQFLAYFVG